MRSILHSIATWSFSHITKITIYASKKRVVQRKLNLRYKRKVLQIRDIFGNLEIKRWFEFAIFFLWITLISRCLIVHYSISILLYFLWSYFLREIINYNFKNVSTFKVVVNYHCHASSAIMCNIFTRWNWNMCNQHFLGYTKNRFSYRPVD